MAFYAIETENVEAVADGGGRHWTLSRADGAWDAYKRGDAIIDATLGTFIGIAVGDYNTALDEIVVDRAGAWDIEVTGKDKDGSNCAVAPGEWIYYDVAGAEFNRDYANGICIGVAMEAVVSGASTVIAVQLHPMPPKEETEGAS